MKTANAMPKPGTPEGQNDFLRADHIGDPGDSAAVTFLGTGREMSSTYGKQLVLPCKLNGVTYELGVKVNSRNHRRLMARFKGAWPKGKVTLTVGEFDKDGDTIRFIEVAAKG